MSIRVLVVEDNFVIALDIGQQLADAGFEIVGLARSVAAALKFVAERRCDVAVLNVNLGGETSEPIVRKLQSDGTPFVTVSGYNKDQLPPLFDGTTILEKPASPAELVAAVHGCICFGGEGRREATRSHGRTA